MQDIEVDVTLTTGQKYSSVLPADSPLLRDLYMALAISVKPRDGTHRNILLQLPVDKGRSACSFMSHSVVSVETRPPVLVQPENAYGASAVRASSPLGHGIRSHVLIDDFLTPDENRQLLAYAIENEANFEGSSVVTTKKGEGDKKARKSRVLFAVGNSKWKAIVLNRLRLHLPHIKASLGYSGFDHGDEELQLTASNDGDFFKAHADADHNHASVAGRVLTFVYYFHKLPKPYGGGDLLFFDTNQASTGAATAVEPVNNTLVAFPSDRLHEVDLVKCPSGAFEDSRFTINGWLRAKS